MRHNLHQNLIAYEYFGQSFRVKKKISSFFPPLSLSLYVLHTLEDFEYRLINNFSSEI